MKSILKLSLQKVLLFSFFTSSCASQLSLLEEAKKGIRTQREDLTKNLLETKQKLQDSIKETREKEGVPPGGNFFYNKNNHKNIGLAWESYLEALKNFQDKEKVFLAMLALEKEHLAPYEKKRVWHEHKWMTFYSTKRLLTSGVLFGKDLDAGTAEVVGVYRSHQAKDLTLKWFVRWDREKPWAPLEINEKKELLQHKSLPEDAEKDMIAFLNSRKKEDVTEPQSFSQNFFELYNALFETLYFKGDGDFLFSKSPQEISSFSEDENAL
jgi:hypothetical protein